MSEINLLKNELQDKTQLAAKAGGFRAVYVLVAILAAESLAYGVLFFWQRAAGKQVLKAEQEIASLDFDIGKLAPEREKALSFQARLQDIGGLLKGHLYWSEVLEELEKVTYSPASYDTLQADVKDHKLLLTGTTFSYTDLAKLMLGLKTSPHIRDVKLMSTARSRDQEAGFSFRLEVEFDPKLLVK